jgi:Fe/S biogenesis protein NfuA
VTEAVKTNEILEVSPAAENKIRELIETRGRPGLVVRVAIRGTLPGGGYQTEFKFQDRSEASDQDVFQPAGNFDFIFEPSVAEKIRGSKVDFDEKRYSAGFNIEYPHHSPFPPELSEPKHWDDPLAQKVQLVIDEYINPGVAGHGGWVLLKDVKSEAAYVEMGGGCQGCGMAAVTLRQGIEKAILQAVPEVKRIIDITAHEAGEDPYYSQQAAAEAVGASPFGQPVPSE